MTTKQATTSSGIGLVSVGLILTAMLAAFKFFGMFPDLTLFQILLPAIIGVAIPVALVLLGVTIMILAAILSAIIAVLS